MPVPRVDASTARKAALAAIDAHRDVLRAAGRTGGAAEAALTADALAGAFGDPEAVVGWLHEARGARARRDVFTRARAGGPRIDAAGAVAASRLYTPGHIVAFLLQNTLGAWWCASHPHAPRPEWPYLVHAAVGPPRPPAPLRELRIVDPCCGCGAFLLAAADMLTELYALERSLARRGEVPTGWSVPAERVARTIVERNLTGADRDSEAVALLTALLRRRAGRDARPGLVVPPDPLGSLDPDVWGEQRFDIVLANPPYVGFRMLDPGFKRAVVAADPFARADLAIAVQSRCVALLADGGLCGTVTPAAWLTSRDGAPLRDHILDGGGPRIAAALGQRVFADAPLLFVAASVVARGARPPALHTLRPEAGRGGAGLRAAVAAGASTVPRSLVTGLSSRPFLPAAPPEVLALAGRGPVVGDLFASFDGVWGGDTRRDARFWWEVGAESGWVPASGGQGNEPWSAPTRLRIPDELAAGTRARDGGIEYPRVAGGRLSCRVAARGTAALAGVVTFVPRGDEGAARREELLALFNSRVGGAWLRTLSSGLNFNPGYAAQLPLGPSPPGPALREAVATQIGLREDLIARDPTADTFADTRSPWADDDLDERIRAGAAAIEELLAAHLGLAPGVMAALDPVRPSARARVDVRDDHLGVRLLRLIGMRWPSQDAAEVRRGAPFVPGELLVGPAGASPRAIAERLAALLAHEGTPVPAAEAREWIAARFPAWHAARFRRRPVATVGGRTIRLGG